MRIYDTQYPWTREDNNDVNNTISNSDNNDSTSTSNEIESIERGIKLERERSTYSGGSTTEEIYIEAASTHHQFDSNSSEVKEFRSLLGLNNLSSNNFTTVKDPVQTSSSQ